MTIRKWNTLTRANVRNAAVRVSDPALLLIVITGHEWEWNPAKRQRMLNRLTRLTGRSHESLARPETSPAVR